MRTFWFGAQAILVMLCSPARVFAQASPTSFLYLTQPAPDQVTAEAYTYRAYDDGSTSGRVLSGTVCIPATPPATFTCSTPFLAYTPGTHTVRYTAANAAGESPQSAPFTFTFLAVPGAPTGASIGSKPVR